MLLSSGKDTDALQTSSQEFMLELVDKYSHLIYATHETNGHVTDTPGKVVCTT